MVLSLGNHKGNDRGGSSSSVSSSKMNRSDTTLESAPIGLVSIVFAIPLPRPIGNDYEKNFVPTFFLYTLPRATLQRPQIDPNTGKRPKEKFVKKLRRKWQEWIEENEKRRLESGKVGPWKKFNGFIAHYASKATRVQSNDLIEVLGRLPSGKNLGKITIIYPEVKALPASLNIPHLKGEEMKKEIIERLRMTKKKTRCQKLVSAALLPFTLAIDILFIIPLLLFEINLVYFLLQCSRYKKANSLLAAEERPKSDEKVLEVALEDIKAPPNSIFDFTLVKDHAFNKPIESLCRLCCKIDDKKFPTKDDYGFSNDGGSKEILVDGLITMFKEKVPVEVLARHRVDEKQISDDFNKILKKAAKQYVQSVKVLPRKINDKVEEIA